MKEQWKPVKGFEGKYIVSNFGNVMSIPRTYTNKLGREYTVRNCDGDSFGVYSER